MMFLTGHPSKYRSRLMLLNFEQIRCMPLDYKTKLHHLRSFRTNILEGKLFRTFFPECLFNQTSLKTGNIYLEMLPVLRDV